MNQLENEMLINIKINKENNKFMLADKGYDTNEIRNKLISLGYEPIIAANKRNTKDETKLRKLTEKQKKIYKNRCKIEHTNGLLKMNRQLDVRYDKHSYMYEGFVYLGCIDMVMKKIINGK